MSKSTYKPVRPENPDKMRERWVAEGFKCSTEQARADLVEYRIGQLVIHREIKAFSNPDVLPPCFYCGPITFRYCETTGLECGHFKKYATQNRDFFVEEP